MTDTLTGFEGVLAVFDEIEFGIDDAINEIERLRQQRNDALTRVAELEAALREMESKMGSRSHTGGAMSTVLAEVTSEELAVVKEVGFGNRDFPGKVGLWFTVELLHGAALQCFLEEEALEIIRKSQVYDLKGLEGKPCVVTTKDHLVRFVRWK